MWRTVEGLVSQMRCDPGARSYSDVRGEHRKKFLERKSKVKSTFKLLIDLSILSDGEVLRGFFFSQHRHGNEDNVIVFVTTPSSHLSR